MYLCLYMSFPFHLAKISEGAEASFHVVNCLLQCLNELFTIQIDCSNHLNLERSDFQQMVHYRPVTFGQKCFWNMQFAMVNQSIKSIWHSASGER